MKIYGKRFGFIAAPPSYMRKLERELRDLGYKPESVEAFYKGEPETWFYVPYLKMADGLKLAREYNQENFVTQEGVTDTITGKTKRFAPSGHKFGADALASESYAVYPAGTAISVALENDA